jgi:LacI family repressor for deo operon, udp, cdd, tsx, nupC, and nupG
VTSIHDVARMTGVSTATVSRALRNLPNVSAETRQAVQRAAAELGYVPSSSAAGLASGRHHTVAVVVPVIDRWFYAVVLEGVEVGLRERGYDLFLLSLGGRARDRDRVFSIGMLRKRADAVIALGLDFTANERKELRTTGLPAVFVGGPVRGVLNVGIDERRAGALAMHHLLELGHERIAHIGGENDYNVHPSVAMLRRAAWEDALLSHGIAPRSDRFASGSFSLSGGHRAALRMLAQPDRPTAVFAASDDMAFGTLLAAQQLGLEVPRDLSVVAIDDHEDAEAFGLTTVRQDPHAQGRLAASLVLDAVDGRRVRQRTIKTDCVLVVRRTTAAPFEQQGGTAETAHPGARPAGAQEVTARPQAPPTASQPSHVAGSSSR